MGPVKIGVARNIESRIRALNTGSPYPLNLLGYIKCSGKLLAFEIEKKMHKRFRVFRFNGEWFSTRILQQLLLVPGFECIKTDHWIFKAKEKHIDEQLRNSEKRLRKSSSTKNKREKKLFKLMAKTKPSKFNKKKNH